MYNLFVSGNPESWDGQPFQIELSRCVREYTDENITERLGGLDAVSIKEIKTFPCIFAYESANKKNPKFGVVRNIGKRYDKVRIQYAIEELQPFISHEQLANLSLALDIDPWELYRTHWAIKAVNLAKELNRAGVILPEWARGNLRTIDITSHIFNVALSFSGESRNRVGPIAAELEGLLGPNSYFYDKNYEAQLARPNLDVLLQEIYKKSKLIVVFLSGHYQSSAWCGIEFRVVRDIIKTQEDEKIMFIKMDDLGNPDGVFSTDGYLDGRNRSPREIANSIHQRVLSQNETP